MKCCLISFLLILPITVFAGVFDNHAIIPNERGYLFEIHGSNTIGAKLAPALIKKWLVINGFSLITTTETKENEKEITAYNENGKAIKIYIAAHGSGTGFKKIKENIADIAAASRPAKSSENNLFPDTDVTSFKSETVLAIDGIAVIINPKIKIESLSIEQVGKLFSGQISNWNELGGPSLAVNVHARDHKSGTYDTFNTLVLKRGFDLTKQATRYESNDQLASMVARTPGAIGFTSVASIGNAKAISIVDGESTPIAPEHAAIATEDYPLARRLYLYQVNTENPFAIDFLSFAKSQQGQETVNEIGFISQNLEEIPLSVKGELPAGYSLITEKSNRITTNFRFKPGTKYLDNKAVDDLGRLAEFMQQNKNRKLILIGFSNQQKDEFQARLLSEARVMTVKRELGKLGVHSAALTGYGHINPVASNEDLKYALRNQRVEVWIR